MQPDLEWALIKARKFGKSLQRILLKLMNHNETLFLGLLGRGPKKVWTFLTFAPGYLGANVMT